MANTKILFLHQVGTQGEIYKRNKIYELPLEKAQKFIEDGHATELEDYLGIESSVVDLSNYATKTELNNKSDKSHTHADYATKTELNNKANTSHTHSEYSSTSHNHNNNYAAKSSEHTHSNKSVLDGITKFNLSLELSGQTLKLKNGEDVLSTITLPGAGA